jgi:hypothetical protein
VRDDVEAWIDLHKLVYTVALKLKAVKLVYTGRVLP